MIYVQKVSAIYQGKEISSHPARYPWWRRLLAFCLMETLPAEILIDVTTVGFTIQAPDEDFLEREAHYRVKKALETYQKHCPDARILNVTYGAVFKHEGTVPLRDYSPNKSRDFDAWVASFS